jgi:prolyl-tRNA synthetase
MKAKRLFEDLQKKGTEVVLDDRQEYTPGWKFNEWELKGVPIRIEIGPRDVKQKQVTLARRDTHEKVAVKEDEAVTAVIGLLEEIQSNLFKKAKEFLEQSITAVRTYDEFKEALKKKGGFIKASWCADSKCEEKIKEETGATIRVVASEEQELFPKCVYCGEKAREVVYFARAY